MCADTVSIRLAVKSDRSGLLRAIVELQEHERALSDTRTEGQKIAEEYLESLEKNVPENDGAIFVAILGEDLVGFIACWVKREASLITETKESQVHGLVSDLYVASSQRRCGVGSKLLAKAEKHLLQQGVTHLRVWALANNVAALEAYKNFGFQPFEVLLEKRIVA